MNKWLTMGVTPPAILAAIESSTAALADAPVVNKWIAAKNNKRDYIDFCNWAVDTFPEGFTYEDIVSKKGKNVLYWRQYIHELNSSKPGIAQYLTYKPSCVKKGRCSIYKIDASKIAALALVLAERASRIGMNQFTGASK